MKQELEKWWEELAEWWRILEAKLKSLDKNKGD